MNRKSTDLGSTMHALSLSWAALVLRWSLLMCVEMLRACPAANLQSCILPEGTAFFCFFPPSWNKSGNWVLIVLN